MTFPPSGGEVPRVEVTRGTAISTHMFTPLPPTETCEVRRPDIRRITKDVRALHRRKPTLPTLKAVAFTFLSVSGFGLAGLLAYYSTAPDSRPALWAMVVYWSALAVGMVGAAVLWAWKSNAAAAFDMEIERIAEDIETLDY
jgi:hypothetical protein